MLQCAELGVQWGWGWGWGEWVGIACLHWTGLGHCFSVSGSSLIYLFPALQEEIARESRRVCKFIIDREIEARHCPACALCTQATLVPLVLPTCACSQPLGHGICLKATSEEAGFPAPQWLSRPRSAFSRSRATGKPASLPVAS